MNTRIQSRQRGFTLLEALIALVVMAFGMLALAGMQLSLSRSGDVAKQRTEAVRLAQRQIDEMRAYTSIPVAASHIAWRGLTGSTTTISTNATYTVATAIAGSASDVMRPLSVTVSWRDRANELQSVMLSSVIAQTDPEKIGLVANPLPLNQPLKRPKNRNINIPIPAKDLGGGYSSTQFNSRYLIVYSNVSGGVVQVCDPNEADASVATINTIRTTSRCDTVTGYIIAGYIGRTSSSIPWPTTMSTSGIVRDTPIGSKPITCMFQDALDQNTGTTITANNGYKYYLCIVPLQAPFLYDGTLRLGGMSLTTNTIACRYQYTQGDLDNNEKNIQPYVDVNKSIDEQNYLLTTGPTLGSIDDTACPASMNVTGVSVRKLHQDCRAVNAGNFATACP